LTTDLININFKLDGISYSQKNLVLHFKNNKPYHEFLTSWFDGNDFIIVKTSGSTGSPKFISLKKKDMISSAKLTAKYFKLPQGSKVINCLPLEYIAGKMMFVRSMVIGWDLNLFPISSEPIKKISSVYDFVALTPMQLEKSLDKIKYVKTVIVGGSPVSSDLREKILKSESNVFETYGMTETITHIAARCLSKNEHKFSALPGIEFFEFNSCLAINTQHLSSELIKTNDVVTLHSSKQFSWIGRKDFIINSGGIKINPEEIETKLVKFFSNRLIVSSISDEVLGQKVVLVFEKNIPRNYKEFFVDLNQYEIPKNIFSIDSFPTTNGKINRLIIQKQIQDISI